ncbi:MAG: alpha-ketoacid dehydrogenase subunit beta [Spirochaetaceae bacterium]|jgi:pyruvate dehydrogenase E1 component beta subunit|nr:alpha-ketoacid dehydrogenase subunit beta [Spirochaetaceae bacterium]
MPVRDTVRELSYADSIREAMCEEMRKDGRIILLGEDVGIYGGAFGVSQGMIEEFGPERIRDTPISELTITGCAVGAAMAGLLPIVEIMFSDFLTLAMEQLVNQSAKNYFQFGGQCSVPLVLRTPAGSGTGAASQHSQSPEAWIGNVPGLKVVFPSTPSDAKGLLKAAIYDPNPVVFLEHKLLYKTAGPVPENSGEIPLGKADVKRPGKDLTIISYGSMIPRCLEAAKTLEKAGIDAELVDVRTLVPLDRVTLIASVKKTCRCLVVHEAPLTGGFGGELAAVIAESDAFFSLKAPVRRLGGLDTPIPFNSRLEAAVIPTEESIAAAAAAVVQNKRTM